MSSISFGHSVRLSRNHSIQPSDATVGGIGMVYGLTHLVYLFLQVPMAKRFAGKGESITRSLLQDCAGGNMTAAAHGGDGRWEERGRWVYKIVQYIDPLHPSPLRDCPRDASHHRASHNRGVRFASTVAQITWNSLFRMYHAGRSP